MDKDSLTSYISKLNDRNLQRQRASGFTLWAIFGVMAFLILDLIDKIPIVIDSQELWFYFIIILVGVIDLFILIQLLLISIMLYSENHKSRRLYPLAGSRSSTVGVLLISSFYFLFSIINLKAANLIIELKKSPYFFWIFSIFLSLIAIISIFTEAYKLIKSYSSKISYPKISTPSIEMKYLISIFCMIISITGLVFFYITYKDISFTLRSTDISLLLKTSIEIVGFFIIIMAYFQNIISKNKFQWLEDLEEEINLENLTESDIRERLERDYIGVGILKWLSRREDKLKTAATEFENYLKEKMPELEEIKQIDGKYQHEITGRRDEICSKMKKKYSIYSSIGKETSIQLKQILKQGIPDKEEISGIENMIRSMEKQLNDIDKKQQEFCNLCKKICPLKP